MRRIMNTTNQKLQNIKSAAINELNTSKALGYDLGTGKLFYELLMLA